MQRPELAVPVLQYNLACVLALQSKTDEALTQLETAVKSGLIDLRLLDEDTDLVELRKSPKFAEVRQLAETSRQHPPQSADILAQPRR